MLNIKFILLCVIVIVNYIYANPAKNRENSTPLCVGLYEKWNECGPACPRSCDNFQDNNIVCTDNCVPSCVCIEGTVRNRWGNCVPEKKCALENRTRALNPDHSRIIRFQREAPARSINSTISDLRKRVKNLETYIKNIDA